MGNRISIVGTVAIGLSMGAIADRQGVGAQTGQAVAPAPLPVMVAPTDKAVVFSLQDLRARFKEMEARKATGWRLIEGGTHNINIRKETNDAPSLHPNTVDVWVVEEGTATLVSGGEMVKDAAGSTIIRGGVSQQIGLGDIVFIPANLPHGVTSQEGITWMNIRYDMVKK